MSASDRAALATQWRKEAAELLQSSGLFELLQSRFGEAW